MPILHLLAATGQSVFNRYATERYLIFVVPLAEKLASALAQSVTFSRYLLGAGSWPSVGPPIQLMGPGLSEPMLFFQHAGQNVVDSAQSRDPRIDGPTQSASF